MKIQAKAAVGQLISDLRTIAPQRPLTYGESLHIARLQATRLREWMGAADTPEINLVSLLAQRAVPVHFVPSHMLDENSGLTTDLLDGQLQVFINESEPRVRQRFSLLHEWKHVLDFANANMLHRKLGVGDEKVKRDMIEAIANEFAAQVLMPAKWVKSIWFKTQDISLAASMFDVSAEAMHRRLSKLGFVDRPERKTPVYFRKTGLVSYDQTASIACAA